MNIFVPSFFILLLSVAAPLELPPASGESDAASDSLYTQPRKESLSTYERSFKPSFYDTEVYLYKKDDTAKVIGRSIDELTTAAPETLQGFRVQILATNVYDEALTVRNDIITRYPDLWVYTVYEVPAYKIRIGDFVNRAEASAILNKFRGEGFRSAWIVPDRIIKNQPPKPPIPEPIDSTSTIIEE
ncbi:MAG: SPOR domain-containing protein [Bacteroidota bacterium]